MTLSQVVESYIAYKLSIGKDFKSKAAKLRAFVKSVGDGDIRRVNPCSIRRFLDGGGPVTANWFYKYQTLATFYRYAQVHHTFKTSLCHAANRNHQRSFNPTSTPTTICASSLMLPTRGIDTRGFLHPIPSVRPCCYFMEPASGSVKRCG
jgi:hypothetical protein